MKKFISLALIAAMLVSLTACNNAQTSSTVTSEDKSSSVEESSVTITSSEDETTTITTKTDTTSSAPIEESSDTATQSKDETTAITDSTTAVTPKADITSTASAEESSDTVTESIAETTIVTDSTTVEITVTEPPATTKAETIAPTLSKNERYVYDEDGNIVDKIKIKVVNGIAYTVGENDKDGKFITGNVPLICNDKKYPSGEAYAASVIMLKFFGVKENVTQDDIAEILPYCGDDAWYIGNDGRKYGPSVGSCLLFDPTKENKSGYNNATTVNISYVYEKFFEINTNYAIDLFKTTGLDYANIEKVKRFINQNHLLIINIYLGELPNKLEWYMNFGSYNVLYSVNTTYYFGVMFGYENDNYFWYDPASDHIIKMDFKSRPISELFSI